MQEIFSKIALLCFDMLKIEELKGALKAIQRKKVGREPELFLCRDGMSGLRLERKERLE